MASIATRQSPKALEQIRENKKKQKTLRMLFLCSLTLTGVNNYVHVQVKPLLILLPSSRLTPLFNTPQLYTDYYLEELMRGISLAVAGNAPDDSYVCDEDLEMGADVMMSDTRMHSQA